MIRVTSVRFFLTVAPSPAWMRIGFLLVVIVGVAGLILDGREVDSAFGMTLFLQMFSASNGFAREASRGWFDPLLVSGRSRPAIGGANLAAAAWPGAMAWCAVSAVALAAGGLAREAVLAPNRHLSFVLVTACAWSAGLALPRFAAGALWSALLVGLALSRDAAATIMPALHETPRGALEIAKLTGFFAVCPFLLLDRTAAAADTRVWIAVGALAFTVAALAVRRVQKREYTLVEGE